MTGTDLFDEVVRLTGVSVVLAPGMIKRSLLDGGVTIESARPQDYEAALPRIRARLKAYLPPAEAEAKALIIASRMAELRAGASTPPSARAREVSGETDLARVRVREAERARAARISQPDYELDATDTTVHGRRWTADERAQIDAARKKRDEA